MVLNIRSGVFGYQEVDEMECGQGGTAGRDGGASHN